MNVSMYVCMAACMRRYVYIEIPIQQVHACVRTCRHTYAYMVQR